MKGEQVFENNIVIYSTHIEERKASGSRDGTFVVYSDAIITFEKKAQRQGKLIERRFIEIIMNRRNGAILLKRKATKFIDVSGASRSLTDFFSHVQY